MFTTNKATKITNDFPSDPAIALHAHPLGDRLAVDYSDGHWRNRVFVVVQPMKYRLSASNGTRSPWEIVRDEDLDAVLSVTRRVLDDPQVDAVQISKLDVDELVGALANMKESKAKE